jgi:hypothetical protein
MYTRLDLEVRRWIATHMPDVGPVAKVRIKTCRRVPFSWIPGNRDITGLTLWNRIYLKEGAASLELLFHELTHVEQFRRSPLLFPLRYIIQHFRYGYDDNPAEVEARERSAALANLYRSV